MILNSLLTGKSLLLGSLLTRLTNVRASSVYGNRYANWNSVTPSIGILLYTDDAHAEIVTGSFLLSNHDTEMAKNIGLYKYCLLAPSLDSPISYSSFPGADFSIRQDVLAASSRRSMCWTKTTSRNESYTCCSPSSY
jgi:hypothetical protein